MGAAWKKVAKANRNKALLGNEIDELLRNCQDGQTNGIPIGPDTSLLIVEILLTRVDQQLSLRRLKGLRYIDDFELVFDSEAEALKALSTLEEALLEFELHLNPAKTYVVHLPQRLEDSWVAELKNMELLPGSYQFKGQLIHFFDRAFELARSFPTENVLKYAAGRMSRIRIWKYRHEMAEDLLIQCARVEAGALPAVLASILRNPNRVSRRTRLLKEMLHSVILEHAPQRHSSEVAWSIWACVALKLQLPSRVVKPVLRMEDSVCALLLLHARSLALLPKPKDLDGLQAVMTTQDLYENRWLLSYEASIQQWLPPGPGGDHLAGDQNFLSLKKAKVSFYDVSQTVLPGIDDDTEEGAGSYLDRFIADYYSDSEDNEMDVMKDEDETEDGDF